MWAKTLLVSAFAVLSLAAAPMEAMRVAYTPQPGWMVPTQGQRGERHNIRPLREVVAELQSRYGGSLIDARLEDGGRPIYVIRWRMPDGQVRDFRVNAAR